MLAENYTILSDLYRPELAHSAPQVDTRAPRNHSHFSTSVESKRSLVVKRSFGLVF